MKTCCSLRSLRREEDAEESEKKQRRRRRNLRMAIQGLGRSQGGRQGGMEEMGVKVIDGKRQGSPVFGPLWSHPQRTLSAALRRLPFSPLPNDWLLFRFLILSPPLLPSHFSSLSLRLLSCC